MQRVFKQQSQLTAILLDSSVPRFLGVMACAFFLGLGGAVGGEGVVHAAKR